MNVFVPSVSVFFLRSVRCVANRRSYFNTPMLGGRIEEIIERLKPEAFPGGFIAKDIRLFCQFLFVLKQTENSGVFRE